MLHLFFVVVFLGVYLHSLYIFRKSIEEKGSMAVKMAQIENNFMEVIRQLGGILDIPDNALDPNSSASSDIICKNVCFVQLSKSFIICC